MTNLKDVNFGINQYCGPAVLSALTGKSTDECAAVISAVTGKTVIKAVNTDDLVKSLAKLRFDVEKRRIMSQTLFGVLNNLAVQDGLYVIGVPKHVVAIRVEEGQILICDNHTREPINAKASARLTQKVDLILKVNRREEPKLVCTETRITKWPTQNAVQIQRLSHYEDPRDNILMLLGQFTYKDNEELQSIIGELTVIATGRE